MTCVILQDDSGSVEDQPRAAEHPSGLGEYLSRHNTEFANGPFDSPEVPQKWQTRKSHYIAPPPIPTNTKS
jgi:hypothetical protein